MGSKIFNTLIEIIRFSDTAKRLTADMKTLTKEVNQIDRRLIRLETFFEIVEKQREKSFSHTNIP